MHDQTATIAEDKPQQDQAQGHGPIRVNLGAGYRPMAGYENIDRMDDAEAYPLPYDDGQIAEVRASHLLEHFSHRDTQAVLNEWARVLRPGGLMKIAVPDFDRIIEAYLRGPGDMPIESFIMGGHQDANDHHGAIFNRGKLTEMMRAAGLRGIHAWDSDTDDCSAYGISLNLAGYKHTTQPGALKRDIIAVMTRPRYIEANGADSQERMALATGIRLLRSGGVFWSQGLTNVIEMALAAEPRPKYILTIDYDTVFRPEDVDELYALMETHPEADAMIPLQMRRDSVYALMTVGDGKAPGGAASRISADALEQDAMRIRTGHFGLTMIRAEVFDRVERPWFQAVPDPGNGWGAGRIDADVAFWLKLKNVYSANTVVVGHAQQVITWPSADLTPIHQTVADYHADGKPEAAR